jgi:predicted nuclease of restriction endonuclease-like (RecB) superfamily
MRKFYEFAKSQPVADQLTWSHYQELLPIKDINEINYYVYECIKFNLTKRELRNKIKNKEYERLDENTKSKLILKEKNIITDFVKSPIIIKNMNNLEAVNEKKLQKLILENIPLFLSELGDGFSFISNEYKIKIGNSYNYIDLLLFNYIYNCFVVIELKVTELKKEHIGQIEVYMNYIDRNIKSINQDNTIGIIICRKDNKFIMSYCSDKRVLSREFLLI